MYVVLSYLQTHTYMYACHGVCDWKSEENLQELILAFPHASSGIKLRSSGRQEVSLLTKATRWCGLLQFVSSVFLIGLVL